MTTLLELDQEIFFFINHDLQNIFMDWLMPYWRSKYTWIPLYLALAVFMVYRFRRKGLIWLLFLVATVAVADTTSSQLIKKNVERVRPCNDEQIKAEVHLLVRCGGGYSFTSSHATNHFAVASFIFFTLGLVYRKWRWIWWLWAASIALGQVYVGVHYPLDITVGGLIGTLIGFLLAKAYLSRPIFYPLEWKSPQAQA